MFPKQYKNQKMYFKKSILHIAKQEVGLLLHFHPGLRIFSVMLTSFGSHRPQTLQFAGGEPHSMISVLDISPVSSAWSSLLIQ